MVYRKKRGRKKKRGPKKKVVKPPRTYVGLKRPYHIITMNNGVQLKDLYSAVSIDVALKKIKTLSDDSIKNVKFPVRFISNKNEKTFTEADYRLALIKRKAPGDSSVGKTKNEYGKYIDCVTDNEDWIFLEDYPYNIEETFWVYGYNPKCQRKTFDFIITELILPNSNNKYFLKQVVVFKNKLLISSIDKLDMVICKNHIDSVRLYNEISAVTEKEKLKYVTFAGDINKKMTSFNIWYQKIEKLTNWTWRKINKNTTRD